MFLQGAETKDGGPLRLLGKDVKVPDLGRKQPECCMRPIVNTLSMNVICMIKTETGIQLEKN